MDTSHLKPDDLAFSFLFPYFDFPSHRGRISSKNIRVSTRLNVIFLLEIYFKNIFRVF